MLARTHKCTSCWQDVCSLCWHLHTSVYYAGKNTQVYIMLARCVFTMLARTHKCLLCWQEHPSVHHAGKMCVHYLARTHKCTSCWQDVCSLCWHLNTSVYYAGKNTQVFTKLAITHKCSLRWKNTQVFILLERKLNWVRQSRGMGMMNFCACVHFMFHETCLLFLEMLVRAFVVYAG